MLLEKLTTAKIEWSKEGYPSNSQYQDKYFCLDGVTESQYVFIEGNQLKQQWQNYNDPEFNLLETGFGSGLNFILTFELWKQQLDKGNLVNTQLQYFSIENAPLEVSDLKKIIALWPQYSETAKLLIEQLPQPVPGRHLLKFYYKQHCFELYLIYSDIQLALEDLRSEKFLQINAFYLDGFSPTKNPKMWSEEIFKHLHLLAAVQATLATYTASSTVLNFLQKYNFKVSKKKGFGSKREMITARSINSESRINLQTKPQGELIGKKYAVIGAGLSGCITAAKLAQQGADVFLIESSGSICQGASGNEFGLAYPRLSNGYDNSCLLHLSGINFLQRELRNLKDVEYQFSGLKLLLGEKNPNSRINQDTIDKLNLKPEFIEVESNPDNNDLELLFHSCGKINPKSLAQSYLNGEEASNNITYLFNTKIHSLEKLKQKWLLLDSEKTSNLLFDGVIICSGFEKLSFANQFEMHTKPVRGQIDCFCVDETHKHLSKPICSSSYIIPAHQHQQFHYWVGASYEINSVCKKINAKESQHHHQHLSEQLELNKDSIQHVSSRVGVRLTSNDRLPIVGIVSDEKEFSDWYQTVLKRGRTEIGMPFIEGLHINIAHGSHGLTTIPILSEHLVKTITGRASPMHKSLQRAISPQRFMQRMIRKQKK